MRSTPRELGDKATLIEETLASFKVDAHVREINPGPAVTQYTLEPGSGVKVRRITELQNDLALALAAPSIRIEAPVPGMARVGIEIPNDQVTTVGLRETIESTQFIKGEGEASGSAGPRCQRPLCGGRSDEDAAPAHRRRDRLGQERLSQRDHLDLLADQVAG